MLPVADKHGVYGRLEHMPRRALGLTLVECMLAIFLLSQIMLAFLYTVNAGHDQLQYSRRSMVALRLADNLMEEIVGRVYTGTGLTRQTYCVDDYDGFEQGPGELCDCLDQLYGDEMQIYGHRSQVHTREWLVPDLDNAVIPGKLITVTVYDQDGNEWNLSRCIFEPI